MLYLKIKHILILLLISSYAYPWTAGFEKTNLIVSQDLEEDAHVYLAGYGVLGAGSRIATGIHDPVYASSLYLSDGQQTLLFVSLDTIGFSQRLAQNLRRDISAAININERDILISATHTHNGPDTQGLWGGLNQEQLERVIARIVLSAQTAYANRRDSNITLAISQNSSTRNRRLHNVEDTIGQLTNLMITRTQDNAIIAILSSFACHPTVLRQNNLHISSDWVHSYRHRLSEQFHLSEPNVLYINGAQGDVLPDFAGGTPAPDDFELATRYGESIVRTQENINISLESRLQHCSEIINIASDNHNLATMVRNINSNTILWTSEDRLETRVSVITLGHLVLITTPGEPVTQLGREIMALVPERHPVTILGLTHDSLGYLLPASETGLSESSHSEDKFSLSRSFGDQVLQTVERLVMQCLPEVPAAATEHVQ